MTKDQTGPTTNDAVIKRLDALIRLFIETNKPDKKGKLSEGEAARLLKSVDLTPTEIARILGKKSATDVSPYLYPKKKKLEEKNEQDISSKEDSSSTYAK